MFRCTFTSERQARHIRMQQSFAVMQTKQAEAAGCALLPAAVWAVVVVCCFHCGDCQFGVRNKKCSAGIAAIGNVR